MLKIFHNRDILKNIGLRSIRKYSASKGPLYDCPYEEEKLSEAERRKKEKKFVHPFLVEPDHSNKSLFYMRLFLFVCIPSIIMSFVYTFHIADSEPKRKPFIRYPYLCKRVKDFPWGDGKKTLFHNPKVNALPDGYETEENEDD